MSNTKTKILDVAERLTQTKGFNCFSYLDLAAEIGIKSSSIHYHFKTKADLALALVERTHDVHTTAFRNLDRDVDTPQERLQSMINFFQGYIVEQKFCMCGMLAAELESVSPAVKNSLNRYFSDFQAWLAAQFKVMGHTDAQNTALRFISTLEGSLLLARLQDDPKIVNQALQSFTMA